MNTWLILPRDPLIFGDGKSFSSTPGERAQSMPFPFPATVAGAVRTLAGSDAQTGQFDTSRIAELKQAAVHGPILAEVNEKLDVVDWFFPAPVDALIVEEAAGSGKTKRYSLAPGTVPVDALTDLETLCLIVPNGAIKNKVYSKAPRFWRWQAMQKWLLAADDGATDTSELGIQGPAREYRTHVRIDPATQTGEDGMLFQTSGMEFSRAEHDEKTRLKTVHQLAMVAQTDTSFAEGLGSIGGERRIARWQKAQQPLPQCPPDIKKKIAEQKHCRLILATPAIFDKGYLPTHLERSFGIKVTVKGVACSRYQTISGWDYEIKKPKPTRRLAPAGGVYFLQLDGSNADIEKFIDAVWLSPVSDDEQSRLDGFGLALLGTWDGKLREVK